MKIDDLTFKLRRSNRRKTVGITIDRGGELIVSAPAECPVTKIEAIVNKKRFWIYTKLAEKELFLRSARKREFVNGEGFLYLGRSYRLKLIEIHNGGPPLRLTRGRFQLDKRRLMAARKLFIRWYTDHGQAWIERRVQVLAPRIGVEPGPVKICDLKSRWGSCGKTLNFHWRTMLLPPRIAEYVVAHELIHRHEPHHTPKFWRRLERVMPDFPSRKQWLAEHGASADV